MARSQILKMKSTLLIFLQCALVYGIEHVPVLMWGSTNGLDRQVPEYSYLSKLSSDDFSDIIMKKVGRKSDAKPVIAVFVEENLSVEDFSWQDAEGHAPFSNLENLTNAASQVNFYPSVHTPLKGLKQLGYRWQNLQADSENEIDLPVEGGVVFVIKLGDAKMEEDRPGLLKRHVNTICKIFQYLSSKVEDVVAVYTSRHSSRVEPDYEPLVRRVRSAPVSSDDLPFIWKFSNIALYFSEQVVFTTNISDPSKEVNLTKSTLCTKNVRGVSESLECRFNDQNLRLEFRFTQDDFGYWYVDVYFNELNSTEPATMLTPSSPIYAPMNFSYHCSPEVMFKNGTNALIMKRFQMQPFMSKTDSFDEPYDCVSFFTIPIWSGLLVTAILGFILVMGLAMIMDINTMDRFDDPKGKAITINVSE